VTDILLRLTGSQQATSDRQTTADTVCANVVTQPQTMIVIYNTSLG